MTPTEIKALREKHSPLELSQGKIEPVIYCRGCISPNKSLTIEWPCDVVKVLDAWKIESLLLDEEPFGILE